MDKESPDLLPAFWPVVSVNGEPQAVSAVGRLPTTTLDMLQVSSQCARQTVRQDLSLTMGDYAAIASLRRNTCDSCGREAHCDGENVTEKTVPRLWPAELGRQIDELELPVLAGDEADATVGLMTMATECSQKKRDQKRPSPTSEYSAEISLRKSEDGQRMREARALSKDDETVPVRDKLHTSSSGCDQGAGDLEPLPRSGDQAVIAHVHKSGPNRAETLRVLKDANSVDEEIRVLTCRCSMPVGEEEVELPEDPRNNVVTRLLENRYNCSVEEAQTQLERDDKWRAGQWEGTAEFAGVKLEERRVGTVYADEKAMDDVKTEIPGQVKYVGTRPALPSSLADIPCADLEVDGMLQYLNHLLRTTYALDRPGLSSVLQNYIERDFDFGLAYGHLRRFWFEDLALVQQKMWFRAAADKARRDRATDGEYIIDRELPPRRAWDLYSNRILPRWLFLEWDPFIQGWDWSCMYAISHSWVDPDERCSVWTPINGRKWPVPVPKDTTLDRVRVELLNVGANVVWLDVLCLWQEGVPEDDAARLEEWKVDVPTIGNIYQTDNVSEVVTYFNGLGRPFRIGNLDDQRHWLNRAWTLQEFQSDGIIGGLVSGSFPPRRDNEGRIIDNNPNVVLFYQRLSAASNNRCYDCLNVAVSVLTAMVPRHAAHAVDKVGGITHILTKGKIPIYVRDDPFCAAKKAWDLLIPVMHRTVQAELFFLYPVRGGSKYAWCPSWNQVNGVLPTVPAFTLIGDVSYREEHGLFECKGYLIEDCTLKGFSKPDPNGCCHTGTLRLVHNGAKYSFSVAAYHQELIPDGSYVLIGDRACHGSDVVVWAVGTFNVGKRFEKLSVLRTEDENDIKRLEDLGILDRSYPRRQYVALL